MSLNGPHSQQSEAHNHYTGYSGYYFNQQPRKRTVTITKEYDAQGKLVKETTVEEFEPSAYPYYNPVWGGYTSATTNTVTPKVNPVTGNTPR